MNGSPSPANGEIFGGNMKQCWKCRKVGDNEIHHINGNHSDNRPFNHINLCCKCHNLVQGICDKCIDQGSCHIKKLQQCWAFEDNLPPIFFRGSEKSEGLDRGGKVPKQDKPMKSLKNREKGVGMKTSMISVVNDIGLKSPVRCEICGKWFDWKFSSPTMERFICFYCVFDLVGSPRKKIGNKVETITEWKERVNL